MDAEMSGINNVDEQGSKDEPGPEINQMDPEASGVDNIQDENGNPKLKGREAYILQRLPITYTLLLLCIDKCKQTSKQFFFCLCRQGVSSIIREE